jgi:peptide/nickel transport system substrate-binding protein
MNVRDRSIVAGLVLAFALLAVAIAVPARTPARVDPSPSPTPTSLRGYTEGIVGRPSSINPLTARTVADRSLVGLLYSGLVRLGPEGTVVGDLAERWTVDPTGASYTFELDPDAVWHDGLPVTAADVVYTVEALSDSSYNGPARDSWREVTATELDEHTVRLDLATPLGGFLQAATQPIAPAHVFQGIPLDRLADDPVNQKPIGSGPFRLVSWNASEALLEPALGSTVPDSGPVDPSHSAPPPTDTIGSPSATERPLRPLPYLPWIALRFFGDADALATAFRAGEVDGAVGLSPARARELVDAGSARLLRYPRATLTSVTFDLRARRPEFRDARVRRALLEALDRRAVIDRVLDGAGLRADAPIPPSSWAFDATASKAVAHDPKAAEKLLTAAGWKKLKGGWAPPGAKAPYQLELIAPDEASNPIAFRTAAAVAANWEALGIKVTVVGLPADEFVNGRLRTGRFAAAVIDMNIGLDPDLYPILASSQTGVGGSNVAGLQDPEFDKLLVAARGPGDEAARKAAYTTLQTRFAEQLYLLPVFFRDEPVVVRDVLEGPRIRQIGDPGDRYWDVLTWRLATSR